MENWIDSGSFNIEKFARSIEKDCQEAVKWERRKLEWILEEKRREANEESEAA